MTFVESRNIILLNNESVALIEVKYRDIYVANHVEGIVEEIQNGSRHFVTIKKHCIINQTIAFVYISFDYFLN